MFDIINLQGVIKQKSSVDLCVKFHPIEIKKYAFALRINAEISDEENENPEATSLNVPIIANGVNLLENQDARNKEQDNSNYSCFGREYELNNIIKLPHCNVRLSTEVLKFGVVPLRANIRRVIMIHNEQTDCSMQFHWQQLAPHVSVKEMSGEIQPMASIACEICIRSETEPCEINNCISCLVWNKQSEMQWTLYLKLDCSIMTDSQIEELRDAKGSNMIIEENVIQTDKPILTNSSLLSPRNQKQTNKMKSEAGEVSIECCKALLLQALNSKIVQNELDNLPPYKVPIAMDMNRTQQTESGLSWRQLKEEMNKEWDEKKKILQDTEFHDFLEYVVSETVFNVTAEMLENFESGIQSDGASNNDTIIDID